ncbi:Universal stress protein family protein [Methylobacterium sp. UNC378MF]|uniref:universal stress protein n=1 Tax=Methylobacterium sp. UNC378MF TaxID=1502748 RepID=UPI00087F628F|nr:universal stress protein [Methylobacterium sp. UNC378MF]SDA28974.1 Universal stress protein family protein [Methylobacterium sp. UNC378MF]
MPYASIMVTVDLTDEARSRVRLAKHLADDCHARLIGVAAEQAAYAVPPVGPTPGSAYALAAGDETILNDLRRAHEAFAEAAGGSERVAWRSNLGVPLPFLLAQAAAADLVVVGRRMEPVPALFAVDPADAVMHLGRPVLLAPPGVDHLDAKRVVVGWKNTREARRAILDALPFLKRASEVLVVSVDEEAASGGQDTLRLLQAHDVSAIHVRRDAQGRSVSGALVETAAEHGADLIVTGAYSHGRLREWVFGGVTRDLLAGAPVCCLMSH